MKLISKFIAAVLIATAAVVPAQAQFKFGVKAGVALNSLSFSKDKGFSSDNRAGFTGGIMADFTVPIIGLGFDASVLYASRGVEYKDGNDITKKNRSYIDIPVNLKWKIGLPGVGKIVTPFITTGPDFSFLMSKKNLDNAFHSKKFDTAWNVGAGVQLLNKVQIAASYGIGLSKSVSGHDALNSGKNRCWTVTAAYLF